MLIGGRCLATYGFVTFVLGGDRFMDSPWGDTVKYRILGDGGKGVQALNHLAADCGYRYIA